MADFTLKNISIIIPVYNVEKFLHQCLKSVFEQNVEGMEVICVNDGSTDNSLAILNEFKTFYPQLIIIDQPNGGLPAARNSGFNVSKGNYIYFLDSDDYLFPNTINQMISFALNQNLDVVVVKCK